MSRTKKARDLDSYARAQRRTRTLRTVVCILLALMSLLPFLLLFVNATRDSNAIQGGVTLIPGGNLLKNLATFHEKSQGLGITFGRALVNSMMVAVPYRDSPDELLRCGAGTGGRKIRRDAGGGPHCALG